MDKAMKGGSVVEVVRCPRCGHVSSIRMMDAWGYWIPDLVWECPECEEDSTTEELQRGEKDG